MMYRGPVQTPARWKSIVILVAALAVIIALASLMGVLIYKYINRSQVEKYFADEQPFGVLVTGVYEGQKTRSVRFLSIASVYPQTGRIGFISFFPQTRLEEGKPTLAEAILTDGHEKTANTLATVLGIEIPFHFSVSVDDMVRLVDLMEGLPFYLQPSDRLAGEELPVGEFILDGLLTRRLLAVPEGKNEYSPAFQLFRHYSLLLNLWKQRRSKWELLRVVLSRATAGVSTDLAMKEMMFLGDTLFAGKGWLPMLMEIPVKRVKDDFVIDTEATALYLKNYRRQLTQKDNPYLEEAPKMEVKNGTMVPNLARELRARLSRKGIQILEFANADRHDYPNTILLDTNGNVFYLESVSRMLGIEKAYHAVNRAHFTDAILILGADYKKLNLEN